jgi:hypothetical protein
VSTLAISGNLFQLIVQNRIAATQDQSKKLAEEENMKRAKSRSKKSIEPSISRSFSTERMGIQRRNSEDIPLDRELSFTDPDVLVEAMNEPSLPVETPKKKKKNQSYGTVFGLSAAADRAARIVSPVVGSLFLQSYGANGLIFVSAMITLYCASIVYLGPQVLTIFTSSDSQVDLISVTKKIN